MTELRYTQQATARLTDAATLHPVNVCRGGVSCTVTTRYGAMDTTNILTLAHYPMTAVLIEYDKD